MATEIVVAPESKETIITLGDGTVVSATVSQETLTVVNEQGDPIVVDLGSGARGVPGSAILVGTGYPLMSEGSIGDIFLSTGGVNVGAVFKKTEDAWVEEGNVRGPAGGIESVNGDFGPGVIIDQSDIGLSEVDNTADVDKPVSTAQQAALDLKANASDTVNLTGAQTIAGVKTFSSAPVVPTGAWAISATSGLQAALDSKSADSAVVHLAGTETITGNKTFTAAIVGNAGGGGMSLQPGTADHVYLQFFARTASPGTRSGYLGIGSAASTVITLANEMTNGGINLTPNGTGPVNVTAGTLQELGQRVYSPNNKPTKADVGLSNVDNTSDLNKPISTAEQNALNLKANLASPTFTGTVSGITATMVGLGNVANLAQVDLVNNQTIAGVKTFSSLPVIPITTPTLDGQVVSKVYLDTRISALVNGAGTALDTLNELATALGNDPNFATTMTNQLALKAPLASPTFTGTVSGITKAMVGLGNVDNTSDAAKPVSTAQQTALNAKENTITAGTTAQYWRGDKTWATLDKTAVGLANVSNLAQVDTSTVQTVGGAKTFSSLITASAGVTVTGTVTATTFSGSGASLTNLPASALSTGTVPQSVLAVNITRVVHGSTASTARPTGATYVEWIGSVQPTNMAANDTWVNTSGTGNSADLFPSGMVVASASIKTTAPSGWYWAEGQEILISGDTPLYNELTNNGASFSAYGANTNGAGAAGSTHFRLPNIKGKTIFHVDGTTEFTTMGKPGGAKTFTLGSNNLPAHTHPVSDPGHSHSTTGRGTTWQANDPWGGSDIYFPVTAYGGYPSGAGSNVLIMGSGWYGTGTSYTSISVGNNSTTNTAVAMLNPYITLRYMIKR